MDSECESTSGGAGGSCDNLQIQGGLSASQREESIDEENAQSIPKSPPPTYEHVLEENRLKSQESQQSNTSETSNNREEQEISQQHQYTTQQDQQQQSAPRREVYKHKSSKQMYKAMAKEFGITCKMSDDCRCLDCQSHYFDCDYDPKNPPNFNHQDGGLGASTPLYISEVMHVGSACSIL